MTRIGSIGNLGSDQLRALNRIHELSRAITQNTTRLSTLRRINSAKDDPAGLVQATLLEREIAAAEAASKSVTRASAQLSTADATAGEIVNQLQNARALILETAGGTLSSGDVAANQIQLDTILRGVDSLAQTEFAGKQLLNGASGFTTSGVDNATIVDVDVVDKQTADDVTVNINVTQTASQATDTYTGGALAEDVTLIVNGPDGSTSISLSNGASLDDIAQAFNDATYLTGITATVDGSDIDLASVEYGSDASFSIEATEGTFTLQTGGTVTGTDAQATINGQSVTGDGSVFDFNTSQLSLRVEVDPTASGSLDPFVVSGKGLEFNIGTSGASTARIGLPSLMTSSLGGVSGKLTSIMSGGENTLTGGKAAEALKIIDDAIADATRSRAIIGGFQKFTLDSSSRVLSSSITNLSSALSAVRDTDVALESALLANNQLLQQTTLEALSITTMKNNDVLSLLKGIG